MMKVEGNMSNLVKEKRDELALEMGWSLERAQGYVDGETSERSGQEMPPYHKVAMDDYSKGFRTGYYTQACSLSIRDIREKLSA
ncbi:MAG: hypothetical protein AMJ66_00495 [Betaproteobacteria bacterium SG8_40]|nr:MAG: hypothetical protein AMJ66_00495 [Betaproteobacteria bacterium SG8_40]